jgi:hypothetical protein
MVAVRKAELLRWSRFIPQVRVRSNFTYSKLLEKTVTFQRRAVSLFTLHKCELRIHPSS